MFGRRAKRSRRAAAPAGVPAIALDDAFRLTPRPPLPGADRCPAVREGDQPPAGRGAFREAQATLGVVR